MPNIKSVAKDVKRSELNRQRNQAAKSQVKTAIKKARSAVEGAAADSTAADVQTAVRAAITVIDRTAKRGIIHKNAAARRKSRLMKRVNAAAAATA